MCVRARVKKRHAKLDALDLQPCHSPQTFGAKAPSAGGSQHQHAEDETPARFFRSAERMRVKIITLHTAMPC